MRQGERRPSHRRDADDLFKRKHMLLPGKGAGPEPQQCFTGASCIIGLHSSRQQRLMELLWLMYRRVERLPSALLKIAAISGTDRTSTDRLYLRPA